MIKNLCFLLLVHCQAYAQSVAWTIIETAPPEASFRGLSVVDEQIAWVSGNKGWTGLTTDGGKRWIFRQTKGFENSDFRSLYAFDGNTAVMANAGSPASILRTTDGGLTWSEVYRNEHKEIFIDGTDFWNDQEGIMYGDPIGQRMLLLRTSDGGQHWNELPEISRPVLKDGEASFAASGTNIRCVGQHHLFIGTGGKVSRVWTSGDRGLHWKVLEPPMIQGLTMTGIFSTAFLDNARGIVAGGDYERDTLRTNHIFYTTDGGQNWKAPVMPTRGLRECVEFITDKIVLAIGKGGADISYDGGVRWELLSDEKAFHVVRKARKGSLIVAAGSKGRLSIVRLTD
ncbi:MAG TPA: YCF48-related protein [Ohtaekwangia sp.]|nr:YCF48-related protein [Ohtaekwangia sp.]